MSRRRAAADTRSLHCRGYDTERIGERELREAFAPFGSVIDVYLPKDYFTKKVRGFAYVQFENEADADNARQKLDRTDLFKDNHLVNVMWAAGSRKTPEDMRRLDIERDNPHARRAREREDWRRGGGGGGWERGGPRGWKDDGGRGWDRDRRGWDRDGRGGWDREGRGGWERGGRGYSRSPPRRDRGYGRHYEREIDHRRFDERDDRRDVRRERDYREDYRKRGRSRSPSYDRDNANKRRRRSPSRSPRGGRPGSPGLNGAGRDDRRMQHGSRSRSPRHGNGAGPSQRDPEKYHGGFEPVHDEIGRAPDGFGGRVGDRAHGAREEELHFRDVNHDKHEEQNGGRAGMLPQRAGMSGGDGHFGPDEEGPNGRKPVGENGTTSPSHESR